MPTYRIETRVTGRRVYIISADNEKDAIAKSVDEAPNDVDYAQEETMSVVEVGSD